MPLPATIKSHYHLVIFMKSIHNLNGYIINIQHSPLLACDLLYIPLIEEIFENP